MEKFNHRSAVYLIDQLTDIVVDLDIGRGSIRTIR